MACNIGLIAYALERAQGGIARYTRELLGGLQQIGADPLVLSAGRSQVDGRVINLPGAGMLPGLLTIGQIEIAWIARREGLDVLHDPTGCLPVGLANVPCVATIHDVIPYVSHRMSSTFDWMIYRFWLPVAVRKLDAVVTDSLSSKKDIVRYLAVPEDKISVIPAAHSAIYRPMSQELCLPALERANIHGPYILYVGSIEPRKNLLRLLEAFARLRAWSPTWNLVIVGARNFWKASPVVEAVKKLELENCVLFTGYIPEEDLPAIYNGADLFVFPSLYEGFGLPVLEAMACGTPVITSNNSSLPEVAGDAAILIDPYNVEELTGAMRQVLSDPSLTEELRNKGLARASQFSWQRTAEATLAVYQQLADN